MTNIERRTAILSAAEKIFATRGFHTATMDEIAQESAVAKGTVYLYFKSKDDLLFSILEQRMIEHNQELGVILDKAKSLAEAVRSFIDQHINFLMVHHNYFKLNLVEQCKMDVREGNQYRVPVMKKHKEMMDQMINRFKKVNNKLNDGMASSLILTITGACHAHLLDLMVSNELGNLEKTKNDIEKIILPYVFSVDGGQA